MSDFGSADASIPPPPRPIEYQDLDAKGWWISMLIGALLVGLGVWMLANLVDSVVVLAWLVGVSLIVGGLIEVAFLGSREMLGWTAWLGGGCLVVAGLVVMAWPDITLWVLAVIAGFTLFVTGAVHVALAIANRDEPGWVADLVLGGLGVTLGVLVLAWPEATVMVLALIFGIKAIVTGLLAIGMGWQAHRLTA
jgi:uncharacterized membrane protein HdeD (DUF308 family)